MTDTTFRIICKRVTPRENMGEAEGFISDQFNITSDKARFILDNPPAVLGEMNQLEKLEHCIDTLRKFDIALAVQEMIQDKRLPFMIAKPQLKLVSKELSKAVRSFTEVSVFNIFVEHSDGKTYLPSLLGKKGELETYFRDCDSISVIGDNHLLILGFSSDRSGAEALMPKIVTGLKNLMGDHVLIRIGYAVFPDDGNSFMELADISSRNINEFSQENDFRGSGGSETDIVQDDSKHNPSESEVFSLCFTTARGAFFNELTQLKPAVLWSALCKVPPESQKNFFSRLPYNSPLIPALAEKIKNQEDGRFPDHARKKIREIIAGMNFIENLNVRKKNHRGIIQRLNSIESLSTLPSIALHVYNIASDPDSKVDDLVRVIMVDPALTLKMLKIVNSPFYGFKQRISTVKQAVIVLGTDEVKNMAFGLALSKTFMEADLKGLIDPKLLWKHSLGTALITSYLCQDFSDFKDAGIFTAGLLHDFGKIFLVENFPGLYEQALKKSEKTGISSAAIEEEIMGIDHAAIGRMISENWNLPASLTQAVSYHHHPSAAPDYPKFAALVGLADYLCNTAFQEDPDTENLMKGQNQLKVDHMSYMKQVFSEFSDRRIEDAVLASKTLLRDNKDLLSFVAD